MKPYIVNTEFTYVFNWIDMRNNIRVSVLAKDREHAKTLTMDFVISLQFNKLRFTSFRVLEVTDEVTLITSESVIL